MRPAMWIPLTAPLVAALVAPGPAELRAGTTAMEDRLATADALAEATGRLHGTWGEMLARGAKPDPCADPSVGSLVARSRVFGQAYRDAVQDARAELDRLGRIEAAPTVEPLLDEADRTAFAGYRVRVEHNVSVWLEMAAWQRRFIEPAATKCAPVLAKTDGVAYFGAIVAGTEQRAVAVAAIGGSFVCPVGLPADGRVVVLPTGEGCLSADASCGCTPAPQLPAAVMAP